MNAEKYPLDAIIPRTFKLQTVCDKLNVKPATLNKYRRFPDQMKGQHMIALCDLVGCSFGDIEKVIRTQ